MTPTLRTEPSAGREGRVALAASWRGLIHVLIGADPAPYWRWRSPSQRRGTYAALFAASLALAVVNVASMHAQRGPEGLLSQPPVSGPQLVVAVAVVAPLALLVRHPLLGWRLGLLALLLAPLAGEYWWGGWPWGPAQVAVLLALFSAAAIRLQRAAIWWMWAVSLVPWWLWLTRDVANKGGPIGATVVFTVVTIALDIARSRRRVQLDLTAQTERTELEQARLAVLEERTRIARELHDVVAHHMSLIAVRAETAPYRLTGLPEPVTAEFQALSKTAREAMKDMRRLLGVLRQDQPAGRAPQPQLSDLAELISSARLAGVTVELTVPPELDEVPAAVGVCAYRIVQESLSNASQHAPGAAIAVSVDHDASSVTLRVSNEPGRLVGQSGATPGRGHGLLGMRERVALLGGSLSAGPAPDGGFVVSAILPIGEAA